MTCPLYHCTNGKSYCNKRGDISPEKIMETCMNNYELCLLNTREGISNQIVRKTEEANKQYRIPTRATSSIKDISNIMNPDRRR